MIGFTDGKCTEFQDAAIAHPELTMAASKVSRLSHLSVFPGARVLNLALIEMPRNYVNKLWLMLEWLIWFILYVWSECLPHCEYLVEKLFWLPRLAQPVTLLFTPYT